MDLCHRTGDCDILRQLRYFCRSMGVKFIEFEKILRFERRSRYPGPRGFISPREERERSDERKLLFGGGFRGIGLGG